MSKIITLKCPVCESSDKICLYHDKLRYGHTGKIYQCECGHYFLDPFPSSLELEKFYTEEYRDIYKDASPEKRFYNDYPEALERLKRLLPFSTEEDSLLEFGSGSGAFLRVGNSYFDNVIGIELDKKSQNFIKTSGQQVYTKLHDIKDKTFDIIVLFHVLEHLPNPIQFLKELKSFLKPSGKIFIEVPHIEDPLISLYDIEDFKDFYFCSAHLHYFSMQSLRNCVEKSGLSCSIHLLQRYGLSNHLHWLKFGKPGTMDNIKFSKVTDEVYFENLKQKGISDTLWAVCSKNI